MSENEAEALIEGLKKVIKANQDELDNPNRKETPEYIEGHTEYMLGRIEGLMIAIRYIRASVE